MLEVKLGVKIERRPILRRKHQKFLLAVDLNEEIVHGVHVERSESTTTAHPHHTARGGLHVGKSHRIRFFRVHQLCDEPAPIHTYQIKKAINQLMQQQIKSEVKWGNKRAKQENE